MSKRSRNEDNFYTEMRRSLTDDDIRLMSPDSLARIMDPEEVNRRRMDFHRQEARSIRRLVSKTEDGEDMERYRATKGDYSMDAREFALDDNVAVIYFNYYGENFEGGEIMDNVNEGYTCPGCKLKFAMSLKTMPDRCPRCGWQTPLGRMKKDGVFRN